MKGRPERCTRIPGAWLATSTRAPRANHTTGRGAWAVAVAAVKNLYAPPLIVLHGRLLTLQPHLIGQLHEKAKARMLAPFRDGCKLVVSQTRKADGALMVILDYLFEELGPRLPTSQTV